MSSAVRTCCLPFGDERPSQALKASHAGSNALKLNVSATLVIRSFSMVNDIEFPATGAASVIHALV